MHTTSSLPCWIHVSGININFTCRSFSLVSLLLSLHFWLASSGCLSASLTGYLVQWLKTCFFIFVCLLHDFLINIFSLLHRISVSIKLVLLHIILSLHQATDYYQHDYNVYLVPSETTEIRIMKAKIKSGWAGYCKGIWLLLPAFSVLIG